MHFRASLHPVLATNPPHGNDSLSPSSFHLYSVYTSEIPLTRRPLFLAIASSRIRTAVFLHDSKRRLAPVVLSIAKLLYALFGSLPGQDASSKAAFPQNKSGSWGGENRHTEKTPQLMFQPLIPLTYLRERGKDSSIQLIISILMDIVPCEGRQAKFII